MTVITKQPTNPTAHLTDEDVEQLGKELDAIRQSVLDARGERDARYIRRVVDAQRKIELGSRAVLVGSAFPPAFVVGTLGLSLAKILENMEIGHNVMHGQWDWMRDPKIHSTTWEWDNASTAEGWKHSHNEIHHTYTNIVGKDNDLGYGIMRVDEDQRWAPFHLGQPLWNFLNMCLFEYGIAAYDLDLKRNLVVSEERRPRDFARRFKETRRKIGRQMTKDYVVHPLVSLPFGGFVPTLVANALANLARNVWSHSVIMCGHFPEGVETFEKKAIPDDETRGQWYLRQMLGSANISGGRFTHLMTGNLSHQIEHHLYPDLPSVRYAEIAPQVREIFERHGLNYHSAPLPQQVASAWHKVVRLSLPNHWLETTTRANVGSQLKLLWGMTTGDRRVRRAGEARLVQMARRAKQTGRPEAAAA